MERYQEEQPQLSMLYNLAEFQLLQDVIYWAFVPHTYGYIPRHHG